MKFYLLFSLIYCFTNLTRAAVMRGTYKDPRYPGKCVVRGLVLSPGDVAKSPFSSCARMFCGEQGFIVVHTCGSILPPEGYKLGEPIEPNAPYPKCCEKHYIPNDNINEILLNNIILNDSTKTKS